LGQQLEIRVPDIGDFDEVEVVEILVVKGTPVAVDDPLVSIESDKATMEIPSTATGTVVDVLVSEGDRVSEGSLLVVLDADVGAEVGAAEEAAHDAGDEPDPNGPIAAPVPEEPKIKPAVTRREMSTEARNPVPDRTGLPHASPLVRRYARELGVPLADAAGSGDHGRVLIDDLKRHVRTRFEGGAADGQAGSGSSIPAMPQVDHAAFGPVHDEPLSRIQKVSGPALHRSWLNVPHVTQYDEADLTRLERFRRDLRERASERGLKLSPLLFVMKAVVIALDEFPTFRSSRSADGDRLVIKDYFHLGIAVDTDQGLVVPVVRDVDQKGIYELAEELTSTAERARARKLGPDDLRGACFTISSLGGIGGTAFSPIVNAPEVAILGLSKTRVQPVWQGPSPLEFSGSANTTMNAETEAGQSGATSGGRFEPRLVLPFSLSYDHRVIDGALAARFTTRLSRLLSDPTNLLL
jgi:pyruvate dehydrogenase E2 component (dihydrolipoamide acetyltransferase)